VFTDEFIALLVALLVITDPLGNVGVFLSITEGTSKKVRREQALKGNLYACALLLVFLWAGPWILSFFGITLNALNLGGGLIVGSIGWGLLQAKQHRKASVREEQESRESQDISFCPLAIPLIAGPGAIAVVITAGEHARNHGWGVWIAATLATFASILITWLPLHYAGHMLKIFGEVGMNAVTKIMGFLLVCIAAQMIITGVLGVLPQNAPESSTKSNDTSISNASATEPL
jgi:multiple antibiotic resistance protein